MTDAPRQCQWCYGLVYGDGPCEKCADDHDNGIHKGFMGSGRKRGAAKLDYQEGNRNEYFGEHHD